MISVEEAIDILHQHTIGLVSESVPFESALGRILAEPIYADRDFPPYNRVAMDGIAIDHGQFSRGQKKFKIKTTIAAGTAQYTLDDKDGCVEIMTGAVLAKGCDTVIPYEEISISDGEATLLGTPQRGQNVHHQGGDRKKGDVIVERGTLIGAPEIGIAATVGSTMLQVYRKPSICLVSTGDELIPVEGTPAPHQIRTSNSYALKAALEGYYGDVTYYHLIDDEELVRKKVEELLANYQILIFIGGSSMGKYDFLPAALNAAGVQEHFYKIKQRPGKPFWFGSRENQFVFALPGNPVSCFLCLEKYYKSWLNYSLGLSKKNESAQLSENYSFVPDLTYFLQVKLSMKSGVLKAQPVTGGGSGDHSNLADVDAFLELPQGRSEFSAGESFDLLRFRCPI